jgi:hypothetical protein
MEKYESLDFLVMQPKEGSAEWLKNSCLWVKSRTVESEVD